MKDTCKLGELPLRQAAVVTSLDPHHTLTPRLRQLGVVNGAVITPLFKSVLGDPVAYQVTDSVIALRLSECDGVTVRIREAHHAV